MLFALAGVVVLLMLFGMLRRKTPTSAARGRAPGAARRSSAPSRSELADVQRASRGGWTPELAGRALAALRIAGSYATGRAVGQRPVKARRDAARGRAARPAVRHAAEVLVSGSATPESAASRMRRPGLADALSALTVARYGRVEKIDSMRDEAVATAIRITKQQRSAHSLVTEWGRIRRHRSSICEERSGPRRPDADGLTA